MELDYKEVRVYTYHNYFIEFFYFIDEIIQIKSNIAPCTISNVSNL